MPQSIKIGEQVIEAVQDEVAAYLQAQNVRLDAAEKATKEAIASAGASKIEADKERARADAAEAEIKTEKQLRLDAADPKRIAEVVRARVQLERQATTVLGTEFKMDSLEDAAIRQAVCAKAYPELKLDGKSPDYVEALADRAVAEAAKRQGPGQVRAIVEPVGNRQDAAPRSSLDAHAKMVRDSETAYKNLGKK